MTSEQFELDAQLARDTTEIADLDLCVWRLLRDARWPWTILVPKRRGIVEIFDLTPPDQTLLTFETVTVAQAMKSVLSADKMNLGAIGNVVPMFHLHVVARRRGDAEWPRPVWGVPGAEAYPDGGAERLATRLREAVVSS